MSCNYLGYGDTGTAWHPSLGRDDFPGLATVKASRDSWQMSKNLLVQSSVSPRLPSPCIPSFLCLCSSVVSTSSVRLFFPSPDLTQRPAPCLLVFNMIFLFAFFSLSLICFQQYPKFSFHYTLLFTLFCLSSSLCLLWAFWLFSISLFIARTCPIVSTSPSSHHILILPPSSLLFWHLPSPCLHLSFNSLFSSSCLQLSTVLTPQGTVASLILGIYGWQLLACTVTKDYMWEMKQACVCVHVNVFSAYSALQHAPFDVVGVSLVQELLCSQR